LSWATRELVANLLWVIAGTGRTDQLINQIAALDRPYRKLLELYGSDFVASAPMTDTLWDWRANDPAYDRRKKTDLDRARDEVVKQSLRIVAARLLGQPTQESQANGKLIDAIRRFEKALAAESRPSQQKRG
jgi:hypothetical protein